MSSPSSPGPESETDDDTPELHVEQSSDESDPVSKIGGSRKVPSRGSKPKPAEVNYRYRKLLNNSIEEAVHGVDGSDAPLPSSYNGASYWTSAEKGRLFQKVSSVGPGQLGRLASAVPTKSEPEIHSYLLLLRRGMQQLNEAVSTADEIRLAEVPAAVEVAADVDATLNRAATILDGRLRTQEDAEEEARYESRWLITQSVAGEIEAEIGESAGTEYVEVADHSTPLAEQQENERSVIGAKLEDEADVNMAEIPPVQTNSLTNVVFPSASLLRPATMLELSRSCFMGPDTEYATLEKADPDLAPSIYRTALDDLHSLTVSITRRLVQATLFQTMTRLRAKHNASPTPHVHTSDVHAAVEILGMQFDRKAYWAGMPSRCGVTVYTEAEKYADGSSATKHGVKLTHYEIEAELGSSNSNAADLAFDDSDDSDDELHAYHNDSDAWTEEGSTESKNFDEDEATAAESAQQPKSTRKRKRAPSPASYARAEDAYLEALDQQASRRENKNLRELLRISSPAEQSEDDPTPEPPPAIPAKNGRHSETGSAGSWRDVVEYEAPWEQASGKPTSDAFARMGVRGARRRRKRRQIEQRLRGTEVVKTTRDENSDEDKDEEMASQVEDADVNDEPSHDDSSDCSDAFEDDSNGGSTA